VFPRAVPDFLALLFSLRNLGVHLPVEIFHNDEIGPILAAWLSREDSQITVRSTHLARSEGWACKPHALLHSTFTQVLLVDVDIAPVINLEDLFEIPAFAATGTLFFHDMVKRFGPLKRSFLRNELPSFDRTPYLDLPASAGAPGGNPCPSAQLQASLAWRTRMNNEAESSVVLFDRCRQPRTAAVLHDQWRWLLGHSHGDKELYWLASELAGANYAFTPYGVGAWGLGHRGLGSHGNESWVCEAMLAQFHPASGDLAWLHGEKRNQWLARSTVSPAQRGERVAWTRLPRDRELSRELLWTSRDCVPMDGVRLTPHQVDLLRERVLTAEALRKRAPRLADE